jgi:hypothetical protein
MANNNNNSPTHADFRKTRLFPEDGPEFAARSVRSLTLSGKCCPRDVAIALCDRYTAGPWARAPLASEIPRTLEFC